jgi:uncharacterized protein YaiL (DUF2058 family)
VVLVVLLDDGILDLIRAQGNVRRPCFLIKSLFEYITSSQNAVHPYTRVPITALQRQRIVQAYSRLHPDEFARYVIRSQQQQLQERQQQHRQQQEQREQQEQNPLYRRLINNEQREQQERNAMYGFLINVLVYLFVY